MIAGHHLAIFERIGIDVPQEDGLPIIPLHPELLIEIAVVDFTAPADAYRVAAHKIFEGRWIERLSKVTGVLPLKCCVQFRVASILPIHFRYQEGFMDNIVFSKVFALLIFAGAFTLPELGMGQAGSLDPTFGNNGIATTANTVANAAALQSDGKIVVAGSVANPQNFQQGGLLRYTSSGVLDSGFGTGGKVLMAVGSTDAGAAFAVAIQTDGKIVTAAPDGIQLTVFRFNTNGTVDNTFGTNGNVAITAAGLFLSPASGGIALQSDGKIVIATRDIVARLLTNGQLDSTFGSSGVAPTATVGGVGGESVAILSNGQILIGSGNVTSLYSTSGSLVTRFGVNGQTAGFPFDGIGGFVVTTDTTNRTKIVTAGTLVTAPNLTFAQTASGFLIVRYNSDGTIDNSFGSHGGAATPFPGNLFSQAFAVAAQTNGDIVAVGQTALTDVNVAPGPSSFGLARYLRNGQIDTTFGNSGFVSTAFASSEAFANTVLIQTDGKIIAAGNSNSGTTLARYLGN